MPQGCAGRAPHLLRAVSLELWLLLVVSLCLIAGAPGPSAVVVDLTEYWWSQKGEGGGIDNFGRLRPSPAEVWNRVSLWLIYDRCALFIPAPPLGSCYAQLAFTYFHFSCAFSFSVREGRTPGSSI